MDNFYKFTAQKDESKPAQLDLLGTIGADGFWEQGFDEHSFKEAMSVVKPNQPLNININSGGGSVFAALCIYNMIKNHKGKVNINVGGLAASAATIITSAPNAHVKMPLGSLMLVHPVRLNSSASMTAEELEEAAENLKKVKCAVMDVYKAKTGLEDADVEELMSKESYLTPQEALDLGFVDEIDTENKVENFVKIGDIVNCNGLQVTAQIFENAPKGLIKNKRAPKVQRKIETMEIKAMDLEQLKAEYPDLVASIQKEAYENGINAERSRIQAIENVAIDGYTDLVAKAKYENAQTAEQLAVAILQAQKARANMQLEARMQDAEQLNDVNGQGNLGIENEAKNKEEAEREAFIKAGAKAFSNAKIN